MLASRRRRAASTPRRWAFAAAAPSRIAATKSQVAAKRAALQALWDADLPAELLEQVTMVASPDPFEYRTRMDYVTSKERFGLRRGGKFNYIVDLQECHLIPPDAFAIARSVYEWAIALGLPDYDLRSHAGFLRYIVVRRSPQNTLLLAVDHRCARCGWRVCGGDRAGGRARAGPAERRWLSLAGQRYGD